MGDLKFSANGLGILVVGDRFKFKDLSFPKIVLADGSLDCISTDPYSNNIFSISHIGIFIKPDMEFNIRYDLTSRMVVCDPLKQKLEKIVKDSTNVYLYHSGTLLKDNKEAYKSVVKILDDLNNGVITLNGVDIDLNTYKPQGEFFKIKSGGGCFELNGVKKYYSIVDDQYTFFMADGSIKSYSNVSTVEMSKDVRLTKEELERLWKS